MAKRKGTHKRNVKKEKDLFDLYEEEFEEMEQFVPQEMEEAPVKKPKKRHKRKRPSHEEELEVLESFLPPEPKTKGKHKVKKQPLWVSPEDLPEESEEDWLKRQQEQFKAEQQRFIELAESGKKFALGTYKTSQDALRKAKRFGRQLSRGYKQLRGKLGKHKVKQPPVQVFVEPTQEGDYAVYGQFKKTAREVKYPKVPIKIQTKPLREEEYVRYGDW
jgi:hypothetical protein